MCAVFYCILGSVSLEVTRTVDGTALFFFRRLEEARTGKWEGGVRNQEIRVYEWNNEPLMITL